MIRTAAPLHFAAALALAGAAMPLSAQSTPAPQGQGQQQAEEPSLEEILGKMMAGESMTGGTELDALVEAASAYPLGSAENPVRAHMPAGQRAYLDRLRCANLKRPKYERAGSAGMSPYGNIVDVYVVTCKDSTPASSRIYIDMYHAGYVENRAVEGYGIAARPSD